MTYAITLLTRVSGVSRPGDEAWVVPCRWGPRLQVLRHDSGWPALILPRRLRGRGSATARTARPWASGCLLPRHFFRRQARGPPRPRYSVALLTLPRWRRLHGKPVPLVVATVSPWLALDIQTRVLGLDGLGDDALAVLCSASGPDRMPSATSLTAARAPIRPTPEIPGAVPPQRRPSRRVPVLLPEKLDNVLVLLSSHGFDSVETASQLAVKSELARTIQTVASASAVSSRFPCYRVCCSVSANSFDRRIRATTEFTSNVVATS